jgi:hypothetical protein
MRRMRLLLVFEPGRAGRAALDLAVRTVQSEAAELTVVSVAPRARSGSRCGNSAHDYNLAVRDAVAHELDQVRAQLEEHYIAASFRLLADGARPSLEQFVATSGFDLVLLPARRRPLRAATHPALARLRQLSGLEVELIDSRSPRRYHPAPVGDQQHPVVDRGRGEDRV